MPLAKTEVVLIVLENAAGPQVSKVPAFGAAALHAGLAEGTRTRERVFIGVQLPAPCLAL